MPAYFGEFSGEESEPHVPTPMETFGKYDKKSLMTGVVIGQGLKGRAHAPSDAPPAGFPADLWEEAKERADAAMKELAAAESGSGSGSATPPDWQFDKDAFCFGLAVGRSLEGWEIDGGLTLPNAMIAYYIHLDEPIEIRLNFEITSKKQIIYVDWGDDSNLRLLKAKNQYYSEESKRHNYLKAGDYIITLFSDLPVMPGMSTGVGVDSFDQFNYEMSRFYSRNSRLSQAIAVCSVLNEPHYNGNMRLDYAYLVPLRSVYLKGIPIVDCGAFAGCIRLETITVSSEFWNFDTGALDRASNLKDIYYAGGTQQLFGVNVGYYDNPYFSSATMHDNNGDVIWGPDDKTKPIIEVPDGVTMIRGGLVFERRDVTGIIIPDSVTYIGGFGSSGIRNVTIPNSVTEIEMAAFNACQSLTSVELPNSITKIGRETFSRCALKSVVIPDGVRLIGPWAFYSCPYLSEAVIPESVKEIEYQAFYKTKLESITISRDCIVGDNAFPPDCEIHYYDDE